MKRLNPLIYACIVLLLACNDDSKVLTSDGKETIQIDSLPGSSPYLTKDHKGNIALSWARHLNDSISIFCYAISEDGGRSFGKTITIPSSGNIHSHSENLPKVIFKPSGEIIALWGAANPNPNNKYSGLVYYSQSFDAGVTWTDSKPLVNDTASYDQRYYDVALLPSGEAAIIWLDNRKTTDKEGSALYFASTNGRGGFEKEKLITEGCCQCCRTDLFVDSKAAIHVLYRGIIKDSIRDMLHSVSMDAGETFSSPQLISNDNWILKGCPHTGPAMTENNMGLHFAWFTSGRNKGSFYAQTIDNGKSFVQHERVSESGSHPQIASLDNGSVCIVWDEPVLLNEHPYRRIGLQIRTSNGISERQKFITNDTLTASYPVIGSSRDQIAVAYTVKKGNVTFIVCQQVPL